MSNRNTALQKKMKDMEKWEIVLEYVGPLDNCSVAVHRHFGLFFVAITEV